ncbi:hypothetical protein WJX73_000684 [Symbiochloris irregularis]|uniref:Regulator of telomere elongation helicase 1 homolog n=1 Tax=Symbiochloris irregularis TaxID=706552 RepID=A0AAW1PTJ1_9CHLO
MQPSTNIIAGHSIEMPHQPYGVQFGFCSRMLQALTGQKNALLEAPTGSGKTLSLLCSALAWQKKLKDDGYSEAWEKQNGAAPAAQTEGEEPDAKPNSRKWKKLPKIFYATRTHSQIAQVVRELKKTEYKPRMAILASREHYCINKAVTIKPNKEEECDKLLSGEGASCQYYSNVSRLYGISSNPTLKVHDIEDLAKAGQYHKACPYFASRHIAGDAELVFCPYNYLLDPVVRSSLDVDINNAVLIFDEAHNIEDTCREAASAEIELRTLEDAAAQFQSMLGEDSDEPELYGGLGEAVQQLLRWLRRISSSGRLQRTEGQHHELSLAGNEALDELREAGLNEEQVELLWDLYLRARALDDARKPSRGGSGGGLDGSKPRIGGLALGVLSRLLNVLHLLYTAPSPDHSDYRLAVQKFQESPSAHRPRGRGSGRSSEGGQAQWTVRLCLWSLNPAVAFAEVNKCARSVILTSGTLSPLDSFASELGADFAVRFEGSHVVNLQEQVWVAALPCAMTPRPMQVTYQTTSNLAVQDAIGQCILSAARIVPDGMLVFFSSYSLLDRLVQRWQATSIWKELTSLKRVVCEPSGSRGGFDAVMQDFYGAVKTGQGAIFLAIYRGKVSEGLDFADANARAVLCFGIPLPSWKDAKVQLKKQHNNKLARTNPNIISGEAWYTQQAFRALNQAVGRCIRHKGDWGAIMLIDERFQQPRYQKGLSRWMRGALQVRPEPSATVASLQAFFSRLQLKEQAEAADKPAPAPEPQQPDIPTPSAEELATKQQRTLHAVWGKPRASTPQKQLAQLAPLAHKPSRRASAPAHKSKGAPPPKRQRKSEPSAAPLGNAAVPQLPKDVSPASAAAPVTAPALTPTAAKAASAVRPALTPPTPKAAISALLPTQTKGRGAAGIGTVDEWLRTDVQTFASHILQNSALMQDLDEDWDQEDQEANAGTLATMGILDCFKLVREKMLGGCQAASALKATQEAWTCSLPLGLACLSLALQIPSSADPPVCHPHPAMQTLPGALVLEAIHQVYSEEIDKLDSSCESSVSPSQHDVDNSHAQAPRQPCVSLDPSTVNIRASGGSLPTNAGDKHPTKKLVAETCFAFRRAYSAASAASSETTATSLPLTETRSVLRIAGPDTVEFLQGILTNDVTSLGTGGGKPVYAALLNAQGRFLHDLFLHSRPGEQSHVVLADTDKEGAPALIKLLTRYKLRAKVSIADVSDELTPWASFGGSTATSDWPQDPRLQALGHRTIAEHPAQEQPAAALEQYHHWRFEQGVPEGHELPQGHAIPLEYNLDALQAISFSKGCYIGQELIARAHYQGVVRKRLMPARFNAADGALVTPGADILDDGSTRSIGKHMLSHPRIVLDKLQLLLQGASDLSSRPKLWPVGDGATSVQMSRWSLSVGSSPSQAACDGPNNFAVPVADERV